MIILRKHKSSDIVIGAELSGVFNGVNQTFFTSSNYKNDSIMITYNGQTLYSGDDFLEVSNNEISLIYLYPTKQNSLKATYIQE